MEKGIAAIETVGARSISAILPLYESQADKWEKEAARLTSYKDANDLALSGISDKFRNAFEKTILLSYLIGNDSANEDKEKAEKDTAFTAYSFSIVTETDWKIVGFDRAMELLSGKGIIPPKTFKEASAFIKSIAFSVQRIEDMNALLLIKESLKRSIDNGFVFRDWKDMMLPEIFKAGGYTKTPQLTPYHLETVFRTNQSSVYNAARYENFLEDDNVEAYRYRAILDDRTRDEHAALNGFVAKKSDPAWNRIFPPNGYKCRCTALPVTIKALESGRYKLSPKDEKFNTALSGVHEDFRGKQLLSDIAKRIESKIKEKEGQLAEIIF